jgi:hypothetical protein
VYALFSFEFYFSSLGVESVPVFVSSSLEKQQVAAYHFLKELRTNPRNVWINGKREFALALFKFKS